MTTKTTTTKTTTHLVAPVVPLERIQSMSRGNNNNNQDDDCDKEKEIMASIQNSVNNPDHHYHVTKVANVDHVYHMDDGDLALNILCGCFLQYYAYDVDQSMPDRVVIHSTVPCHG